MITPLRIAMWIFVSCMGGAVAILGVLAMATLFTKHDAPTPNGDDVDDEC